MNYLMILWSDESQAEGVPPEQMAAVMQLWTDYTDSLRDAGVFVAGDGLTPSSSGTTVSAKDGQRIVTDGPFAETQEQINGYYLIDVPDLDAALGWAEKVPNVAFGGSVEVRPIMEYPEA